MSIRIKQFLYTILKDMVGAWLRRDLPGRDFRAGLAGLGLPDVLPGNLPAVTLPDCGLTGDLPDCDLPGDLPGATSGCDLRAAN